MDAWPTRSDLSWPDSRHCSAQWDLGCGPVLGERYYGAAEPAAMVGHEFYRVALAHVQEH